MKRARPVLVTWRDATQFAEGWVPVAETKKYEPSLVRTVGFIVRRDRRYLVLAQSVANDGDVIGVFMIPRGFIERVTHL